MSLHPQVEGIQENLIYIKMCKVFLYALIISPL